MNLAKTASELFGKELLNAASYVPKYDFEQEPVFRKWNPADGSTVEYPLHAGQKAVWSSTATDVAAIAGARSGKTALGPWLVAREIQRNGGGDALIVGPTFPLMDRRLVPECIAVWQHLLDMGEYKAGRRCFVFSPKGLAMLGVRSSTVWFGFAEDPESLESMEAACAWCDEAGQSKFSREAIEAVRRRVSFSGMSRKAGRIFYTTTPYSFNWFKTDVHDKALEKDSGVEPEVWPCSNRVPHVYGYGHASRRAHWSYPHRHWGCFGGFRRHGHSGCGNRQRCGQARISH